MTAEDRKLLAQVMEADRFKLRRTLRKLENDKSANKEHRRAVVLEKMRRSAALRAQREQIALSLEWPVLPVTEQLDTIREAIEKHQVLVLAGETGSGKTTQLPKICLSLGRGRRAMIGHTQPRRLAARSVANRIAEEIGSSLGAYVGYKVRFQEQVSEQSLVKVMTDGTLLAEIQQDPYLNQYDTIIIDEAHERSLNIDFLMGYLKQLLPKRPDLKLIITSATIDHERFAKHFNDAPVITVSGRTYPVTVHYRPPQIERDLALQVEDVLHEIEALEHHEGLPVARDVLVFLSGERDIRDVHHHLKKCQFRELSILPLYARLSQQEQQKIFAPHRGRRVVLSTNVAETSLTVPGIRYVIDAGTARISRYSVHSKVQRLPIEPVSQASANQRMGRSGRIMPGVCYRLYSEEDFNQRPAFTDPEIRRTNLASVILQMADLRLGDPEQFPFLDAPEGTLVRDGYRLLEELRAVDGKRLTPLGKQLARLPVDPRLAAMLLAAPAQHALQEVLIIVAALAVQDVRERPAEARQQADQAHQPFVDKESDFLFFVKLWAWLEQERENLSRSQFEKKLKKTFLSPLRVAEWRDTHRQLLLLCRELKLNINTTPATYEQIHRAILSGLLSQIMKRTEEQEWLSTRNRKPQLWPGSALAKTKAQWLVSAEQVETSRLYARTLARVEPEWIEQQGSHLVKRTYLEPYWSRKRGALMATEQVSLWGLIVRADRQLQYGNQNPTLAREMLVREGLVNGEMDYQPDFLQANRALIAELEQEESKLRRRDLLADEEQQLQFYLAQLPEQLISVGHLKSWYQKQASAAEKKSLRMTREFVLGDQSADPDQFPAQLPVGELAFPLRYVFNPGSEEDGVWMDVPAPLLGRLHGAQLDWLVPGLLPNKVEALIRALPKNLRRHFVPVPDVVAKVLPQLNRQQPFFAELTRVLQSVSGVRIEQEQWLEQPLPAHLQFHLRVLAAETATHRRPRVLAKGQNLAALQTQFAEAQQAVIEQTPQPQQPLASHWVFGELPVSEQRQLAGVTVQVWPALRDAGQGVRLVEAPDEATAGYWHQQALCRLVLLQMSSPLKPLREKFARLPVLAASQTALWKTAPRQLLDQWLMRAAQEHFQWPNAVRNAETFSKHFEAGRGDFIPAAEKTLDRLAALYEQRAQLHKRLTKNFPLAWAHAHKDISGQLADLWFEDFLKQVPDEWLSEYSRYLKAIELRLDKLGGQLPKDRAACAQLQQWQQQWQVRVGNRSFWQLPEPLITYRFLLEEYRVSLFAQQLGTRLPVSEKRLKEQWQKC